MNPLHILMGLSLLMATGAQAAENVFLSLKANGSGIKGESTMKGREHAIECTSYEQEMEMINGKRVYKPLVIIKRIDQASPLMMKAMIGNENISATFKFYRPNPMGAGQGLSEQFYTVTLTNARIISMNQILPDTRDQDNATKPPSEEVQFSFSKISWTYNNGGIVTEDDAVQMASVGDGGRSVLRLQR